MTQCDGRSVFFLNILIHTSVKLVTGLNRIKVNLNSNFNPHEREARDASIARVPVSALTF